MLKEHWINQFNNFICGWYIDYNICNDLIEHHKNNKNKGPGKSGEYGEINKQRKDSIDCRIDDSILKNSYFSELQKCVDLYIQKYPFCNEGDPWRNEEVGQIQYYPPLGGYHHWHTERLVYSRPMVSRHLVFLTYLNSVTDQGETEFFHQKLKISPEKGLTIIWPVDWTFTHRGITSPTQEKYIYTGWFSFYDRKDAKKEMHL